MTTELHHEFFGDAANLSDSLAIGHKSTLPLAAEIWTMPSHGQVSRARESCLAHALEALTTRFPSWMLWILVTHKAAQPDTRIARHNKLWKSLENRGLNLPAGIRSEEVLRLGATGLRFHGAIQFDPAALASVNSIMMTEAAVIVFGSQERVGSSIAKLVASGWDATSFSATSEDFDPIFSMGGMTVDLGGEFDDPDVSTIAFGKADSFGTEA